MIWKARRAKRHEDHLDRWGPRLLCGRMVAGQYVCPETVAWYHELIPPVDEVSIPDGLTDAGSPGRFRWSAASLDRIDHGADPRHDPRPRSDAAYRGAGPRLVAVPLTLPCAKRHMNEIDSTVLRG